jgi:hypothetical protein
MSVVEENLAIRKPNSRSIDTAYQNWPLKARKAGSGAEGGGFSNAVRLKCIIKIQESTVGREMRESVG